MNSKNTALKTIVLGLVLALLLPSLALASSNPGPLSLEAALDMAIKNSKLLELNRLALENKKVGLDQARYTERKFRKMDKSNDPIDKFKMDMLAGQQVFNLEEESLSLAKKIEIDEANMKAESIKKGLGYNVTRAYYGALQARDMLEIKKDTLNNLEDNFRITKRKQELGTASKSQVYLVEIDLNQAKIELDKAERNYRELVRSLNNLLGLDLDHKLQLSSDFKMQDVNLNLKDDLEKSLNNRYDFINSKNTLKLAQLNFDLVKKSFTPNTFKYQEAEINLKTAQYIMDNFKKDIELDIRSKYDRILSSKKEFALSQDNIKKAQEGYRISKLQYELNTITILELNEALLLLSQARLASSSAMADYEAALIDYSMALEIGNLN